MANSFSNSLELRAQIYNYIRFFFLQRKVLEVETPLLLSEANPSPYLDNFSCDNLYLQTSPEIAMKYLLARGSGDIYQLCKAFRKNERGRIHNPEFTILEWYRINFDHHKLMDEVEELIKPLLKSEIAARYTYQEVCEKFMGINPHETSLKEIKFTAKKNNITIQELENDEDSWMQLLFTHLVEPQLPWDMPIFVYDFPVNQAMLARIHQNKYPLASRFELYYRGIELANGFHELNDAKEHSKRFTQDLVKRKNLKLPPVNISDQFISTVAKLPNCSGVAMGIDRLILLIANAKSLDEIMPFR